VPRVPGEARRRRLRALLARAGAAGADPKAFEAAFVHQSAVRERLAEQSNQRLEFVGDAILGYLVARSLFERYPDAEEGELALRKSSLVADVTLAATAERLGFEGLLLFGHGTASMPPARRRSALADAFEAFLALLHFICGEATAAQFVARELVAEREKLGPAREDPKTVLQEWTQRRSGSIPSYTIRYEGPDHERTFFAQVSVPGEVDAEGSGPSKKTAERAAAAQALAALGERYDDVGPRALSPARTPGPAAAPGRKPTARASGEQTKGRKTSNGSRP
jgi:ribonuclease-3